MNMLLLSHCLLRFEEELIKKKNRFKFFFMNEDSISLYMHLNREKRILKALNYLNIKFQQYEK